MPCNIRLTRGAASRWGGQKNACMHIVWLKDDMVTSQVLLQSDFARGIVLGEEVYYNFDSRAIMKYGWAVPLRAAYI